MRGVLWGSCILLLYGSEWIFVISMVVYLDFVTVWKTIGAERSFEVGDRLELGCVCGCLF